MGNSGSTHNINWDSSAGGAFTTGRSKSELNTYYQRSRHNNAQKYENETQTQTLLRKQHHHNAQNGERIKSLPPGAASEQFKVLPKIAPENERLKLRPTTNGMLLNAGGTISGRNKDDVRAPGQMQRSRTMIFDQRVNNEDFKENLEVTMPSFQRSQTLLHMSYKERDNTMQDAPKKLIQKNVYRQESVDQREDGQNLRHARSEPDFRNDLNKPTHARQIGGLDSTNVPATTTTTSANKQAKLNKYNKKRKAPAAPPVNLSAGAPKATKENNIESKDKTQITRRFRPNVNVKTTTQQPQLQTPQSPQPILPKAPIFRREKSCDAILLRSKTEAIENSNEKRYSYGSKTPNIPAPPVGIQSNLNNPTLPKQTSKIPQLKRTFYFGMQSNQNEDSNIQKAQAKTYSSPVEIEKVKESSHALEKAKESNKDQTVLAKPAIVIAEDLKDEQINTLKYKLHRDTDLRKGSASAEDMDDEESQINDNGILVHIRPALPRRQLEVPSFSPAAAWRMLLNAEEDRHRQIQRSSSNALSCESPIQLRTNKTSLEVEEVRQKPAVKITRNLRQDQLNTLAWTPQQDLEDDDDDDGKIAEDNDTSSSEYFDGDKDEEDGLLFFNGHTNKKGRNETSTLKGNEKSSSIGIHLFSLSLPRDSHMDSHMQKKNSVNSNNNEKTTSFSSLQKLKLTISGGGNKCTCRASITKYSLSNGESSTDAEICEIHSNQAMYRSDNWVLHKTGTKDGSSNVITSSNGKLLKEDITPTVEPISLSFLTAGKHVMYLPGMTAPNKDFEGDNNELNLRKETTPIREATKSAPRQRQRKKETRESLQDETPVLRQHQSQVQSTNSATQRFSFQSTVRILEKRRLAEKLSRDAEIREAQRKSELEAMKRVEEDFQRKRASEKANIRHQLRLYCSGSGMEATHDQYNSLPAAYTSRQQQNDTNNNKITGRRTEPEGAAASPSPSNLFVDMDAYRFGHQISHLPLKRMDSDCGDSDTELRNAGITHFNRTASMVEPYLQSFMK